MLKISGRKHWKRAIVGFFGLITIGIVIVAIALMAQDILSKATEIKANADIFVEVNDQSSKMISLFRSKTGDLSYMEMFAYIASEQTESEMNDEEIENFAKKFGVSIIIYDSRGNPGRTYGERKEGDKIQLEIPLPHGGRASIAMVTDLKIPVDLGLESGEGWSGQCVEVAELAKQYIGAPYKLHNPIWDNMGSSKGATTGDVNEDARPDPVTPEEAKKDGIGCVAFVQSVYLQNGLSPPRGNGKDVCDSDNMDKLGKDASALQPGDLFAASASRPEGHTGMYVGKGKVDSSGQTFTEDPEGEHIFIHSIDSVGVGYSTFDGLFGSGKRDLYSFCRHKEMECRKKKATNLPVYSACEGWEDIIHPLGDNKGNVVRYSDFLTDRDNGRHGGRDYFPTDVRSNTLKNWPVYAVKDGTATFHDFRDHSYGYYVTIDHGNGRISVYAHLGHSGSTYKDAYFIDGKKTVIPTGGTEIVRKVRQGDVIGFTGTSGTYTVPEHLHFEMKDPTGVRAVGYLGGTFLNPKKCVDTTPSKETVQVAGGIGSGSFDTIGPGKYATEVYKIGSGKPIMVVLAGVHGDERGGPLAAQELTKYSITKGTLIVIPNVNKPAQSVGKRYVQGEENGPYNLNRCYPPGRTEAICRGGSSEVEDLRSGVWGYATGKKLGAKPDVVLNLHSGDTAGGNQWGNKVVVEGNSKIPNSEGMAKKAIAAARGKGLDEGIRDFGVLVDSSIGTSLSTLNFHKSAYGYVSEYAIEVATEDSEETEKKNHLALVEGFMDEIGMRYSG